MSAQASVESPPAARSTSPPPVRCRGVVKRYGDLVAVDGLDLELEAGECFGLLGPNGAGKTTTIEILEGLLPADEGTVEILGMNWTEHERQIRQRLGIQLQETRLGERLSVEETVRLFRSFYDRGLSVESVLRAVQLEEKRRTWVGKLSGGQRQRLAVACALVGDPDVLFLDEPTTGLDPQSRRALWDLIQQFRDSGRTVLLTTHYMDEAARLCDRIAIMDHGQIISMGTPAQLVASLGAEHVVEFTLANGASPILSGLTELPGVTSVRMTGGLISVTVREVHTAVPALLAELDRQGAALAGLSTHHATLEDVFVALTGRRLRDD